MKHIFLSRNQKIYTAYNTFRKKMFEELAAKDSDIILYLLPWLLSINEQALPGYIKDLERPFRIYGIDYAKDIRSREPAYKKRFGVRRAGTLLKPESEYHLIQGLYTIGSVGSVAQTTTSDCDIWICIEKDSFDRTAWLQLNRKVNLIKDWIDVNVRMPVYFFICDVEAIRECRFGNVDLESSGSTQQNVLKEEFYRTGLVICGKTPLWWVCRNPAAPIEYETLLKQIQGDGCWEYDLIDFGNIENIEKDEYFGAALWQLHKSLSRPLKSMMKIFLLKSLLDESGEQLLCNRFRDRIYNSQNLDSYPDFSLFTMESIVGHFQETDPDTADFLLQCYYMQCEINPYNTTQKTKNRLVKDFLKRFPLDRGKQLHLRKSTQWDFKTQVEFGNRIFKRLLSVFSGITSMVEGVVSDSDRKDLTILGRRISSYYSKKAKKVHLLQSPKGEINVSNITFNLNGDVWQLFADDINTPIIWSKNIVFLIAYIVWNGLFIPNGVHMRPNPSNVTLNEVLNLCDRIKSFFGGCSVWEVPFSNYLKKEAVNRMLVVLGHENSPWYAEKVEICPIYTNGYGEMYVDRLDSLKVLEQLLKSVTKQSTNIDISFYVQRNSTVFEKLIEKTRKRIALGSANIS
ncbi:MAG: hypothetical protein HKM93_06770 [Desulfobacteraceae bacterium]|nr:hypothetical protein [Desulfobacteraceae bacterium]